MRRFSSRYQRTHNSKLSCPFISACVARYNSRGISHGDTQTVQISSSHCEPACSLLSSISCACIGPTSAIGSVRVSSLAGHSITPTIRHWALRFAFRSDSSMSTPCSLRRRVLHRIPSRMLQSQLSAWAEAPSRYNNGIAGLQCQLPKSEASLIR